ncbi:MULTISPECIES: hypothetical protein [Streptomyces]|uniref:Uncharacterized protein n=1 Tax=Streptomyces lycii TaxID=2654337 RepID=A0ABQ7FRH0_9ACTN|nr:MULTISPECIES: hypothetical protein [Streptomyces]KAF4410077.1 hypothetical protein GCU69_05710 [Streptomyces lycii]PGH51995.1 hypothetical protein CRI70_03840 [Streptomyces sp. Ru87]
MSPAPGVLRVEWVPGSDQLLGTCHCGARQVAESPAEIWQWLLAHPEGHEPPPGPAAAPHPERERQPALHGS